MRVEGYHGWSVAVPLPDGGHSLSPTVEATRDEAIRSEASNMGEIDFKTATPAEVVSRAWKRLYRRGFRAIRVVVCPDGMEWQSGERVGEWVKAESRRPKTDLAREGSEG